MKKIEAYIKRHRLAEVTHALHQVAGLTGMSILECRGFGRGHAKDSDDAVPHEDGFNYIAALKLELVCSDDLAKEVVATIENAAHTGLRGDGKIYVSAIEEAVRISSGERGAAAV